MSKRFLGGLVLIMLAVLVLLISGGGEIRLNLLFTKVDVQKSLALFIYMVNGVLVGFLLR
ncbi:MAG TPA: hypothetical protein DCS43_11260 [Verrucomicrobia bacterium]|nr:hypothetical protein [Verrucomicrobiota bacterium]